MFVLCDTTTGKYVAPFSTAMRSGRRWTESPWKARRYATRRGAEDEALENEVAFHLTDIA